MTSQSEIKYPAPAQFNQKGRVQDDRKQSMSSIFNLLKKQSPTHSSQQTVSPRTNSRIPRESLPSINSEFKAPLIDYRNKD